MKYLLCIALTCFLFTTPASARHHHNHQIAVQTCTDSDIMRPTCGMGFGMPTVSTASAPRSKRSIRIAHASPTNVVSNAGSRRYIHTAEIVSHPHGCPSRAFCGCGAAVHIFGSPIRSLWLAANWFRFPRAAPAPGMAAVRRHHVFVLEQHIEGSVWLAYDANSGHHATRIHARSIAGYTIVNPHG